MFIAGCTAAICFDPELNVYDLSKYVTKPPVVWEQYNSVSPGIDLSKIKLSISTQNVLSVDEFVRLTVKHIHAMGFLAVSEQDERLIDGLVAKQLAGVERKSIARKA